MTYNVLRLFFLSDLRMNSMVLDMPAGYVCRITPLVEQKVGATLGEIFYKTYLPFLEQVIRLKVP